MCFKTGTLGGPEKCRPLNLRRDSKRHSGVGVQTITQTQRTEMKGEQNFPFLPGLECLSSNKTMHLKIPNVHLREKDSSQKCLNFIFFINIY